MAASIPSCTGLKIPVHKKTHYFRVIARLALQAVAISKNNEKAVTV